MEPMKHQNNQETKTDLKTASVFFVLALLTGLLVLGMKWSFMTPNLGAPLPPTEVPAAK